MSLIFWNKLDNNSSTTTGEIGGGLTITGTDLYGAAKFNDGIGFAGISNYATSTTLQIPLDAGTIECWFKPRSNWDDNNSHAFLVPPTGQAYYVYCTYSRLLDCFQIGLYDVHGGGTNNGYIRLYVSALSDAAKFSNGDLLHVAFTWDVTAGSTITDRLKIWINGIDRTSDITSSGTINAGAGGQYMTGFHIGKFFSTSDDNWSLYGYADNLKVWNNAKTDFSDRFTENAGAVTTRGIKKRRRLIL